MIGDCGRYRRDPVFAAQTDKLMAGLKQAVTWYEEGTVRPFVTHEIPLTAPAVQKAFEDFLSGSINVGKVVVRS